MKLREYLKHKNLTIEQFAQEASESPFTVGKWVRGERLPREETMVRIFEATGGAVRPDDFYNLPNSDETAA